MSDDIREDATPSTAATAALLRAEEAPPSVASGADRLLHLDGFGPAQTDRGGGNVNSNPSRQAGRTLRGITGAIAGVIAVVAAMAVAAPSAQGAFPGANGMIVFSRYDYVSGDRGIYVMSSYGTNETRLTSSGSDARPAFSPDGSRIVFFRYGAGIFVMNADGSGQTQLTHDEWASVNPTPAFSADGSRIVWVSRDPATGIGELFVMNADGTHQTQLTNHSSSWNYDPVFSPDGSKIAFIRSSTEYDDLEVYVMNTDGTNVTQVTHNESDDWSPDFSPDGSKIVFGQESHEDRFGGWHSAAISVIDAEGTNQTRLTDYPEHPAASTPVFSPDGSKIAFSTGSHILVMNANGSGKTQLTNDSCPPDRSYCVSRLGLDWQARPLASTTTTTSTTMSTTTTTMPPTTTTTTPPTPMARIDCREGGWQERTTADGTRFSNQGQCMQYFSTGTLR